MALIFLKSQRLDVLRLIRELMISGSNGLVVQDLEGCFQVLVYCFLRMMDWF